MKDEADMPMGLTPKGCVLVSLMAWDGHGFEELAEKILEKLAKVAAARAGEDIPAIVFDAGRCSFIGLERSTHAK